MRVLNTLFILFSLLLLLSFSALAQEEATEEETEEEEEPELKTSKRIRLSDPEEIAIHAIKRAKGCTLVEATRYYLGEQPARAAETTQEQESAPSETSTAIEAKIEELHAEKLDAIRAIDVERQAELETEIRQLEKKARQLAVTEAENAARTVQTQHEKAVEVFDASWGKSLEHYPSLSDPNSAMYKEIQRLEAQAIELGDPLAGDPARLWDFAKKAGLNTRTPMTKPQGKQSSAPAKGKTGSPVKPAAGNRGTTSAEPNQVFVQKVEGYQSLDEYEEDVRRMMGKA